MLSMKKWCAHPWQQMNIDWLGNVRPCCFNKFQCGEFGNVNRHSIDDIWNGERFVKLRKCWVSGDLDGTGCENCRLFPIIGVPRYDDAIITSEVSNTPWAADCLKNKEEYEQGIVFLHSRPKILQYYPSTLCNLNCDFCYQIPSKGMSHGDSGQRMLTDISPYLHTMNWIGGEPTIQREVRDWVRTYSRINNKIRVVLGTNFANVDHTFINDLALFQSAAFYISLDACEKGLYEELRHNACWERTYENLCRVLHLRDGGTSFGITVSYLWQKRNLTHLPVFLRFCQEHRIKCIVSPLDEYPLPMRIDLYADTTKDLPDWIDDIFEESLREASILDKVTQADGKHTESYVENAIRTIKKGIARARRNTHILMIPIHSVAKGCMAVAENSQGEPLSYSFVSENGTCRLAIPPGEAVVISLYRDIYRECVLSSPLMSYKISNESTQKEHTLPLTHDTLQAVLFKLQLHILSENQYVRGVLNKGILAKYQSQEIINILNSLLLNEKEGVYHFLQGMSSTALASLEDIVNTCLLIASREGTQELINRLKTLAATIMAVKDMEDKTLENKYGS